MTATTPAPVETPAEPLETRTGSDHVLLMEDATVRFGDVVGVQDVSLSVPGGTILGVIGPSGAGKTTTIRLLTGGLAPSRGRIRVLGEDPRRFHRRTRERIGYMPQQFTLYPDLTAGENVDFVASLFGLLFFRRRRRVREALEVVDLWDVRGRRAANLSGGQQRRLELASALVHEPDLLFLDEPTAGIDPLLRARVWDELHRLKDAGRTLLVTTQYVNEAEECDQVALIAQGRLAALAAPEELRRQATGGDVIEVETATAFEGSSLMRLPEVRSVSQVSPRSFRVVVDDVGSATPEVVEAIGAAGGDVVTAREYRLTFDEVFAELVERNRRRLEVGEEVAGADADARQRSSYETRVLEREGRAADEATLEPQAVTDPEVVAPPEPERDEPEQGEPETDLRRPASEPHAAEREADVEPQAAERAPEVEDPGVRSDDHVDGSRR